MKVVIEGHLACDSAGDDAGLEAFTTLLRGRLGDRVSFVVPTRHPNPEFDAAFGVRTVPNLEYPTKQESQGRWLRGFNPGDDPAHLLDYAREIERADLFVFGIGNFLNENSYGLFRGPLARVSVAAGVAKSVGTPSMLFGLSASRLESELARAACSYGLRTADAVVLRERDSIELLEECGITTTGVQLLPDPVVLSRAADPARLRAVLEQEGLDAKSSRRTRLGVSVRSLKHMGSAVDATYMSNTVQTLLSWVSSGGEVILIPQQTYGREAVESDDREPSRSIAKALGDSASVKVVQGQLRPWEVESLWSICDLALCTRLHAGVFACKQGIPVVSLAYEPKVSGFWRQMGVTDYCLPLGSTPDAILGALSRAHQEYPSRTIQTRLSELQREATRYADIALSLAATDSE